MQLPNVAEFLSGVLRPAPRLVSRWSMPFSHNWLELLSYAERITPRLFIGSLAHPYVCRSKGRESELLTKLFIDTELVLLDGDAGRWG